MAPVSTLSFKCALITGGGGGIGRGFAEALIALGKSVIIVGRTEAKLKKTAAEIGAKAYYVLDISKISTISGFVQDITSKHPELDCLINNAGVQRPFQILGPEYGFDLGHADEEIDTNIRGPLHLCVSLVPPFQQLRERGGYHECLLCARVQSIQPSQSSVQWYESLGSLLYYEPSIAASPGRQQNQGC